MNPIDERELNSLVMQYLNVANVAIDQNRERESFERLLTASRDLLEDKRVGLGVYEEDPSEAEAFFTITMKDDRLDMLAHGAKDTDFEFKAKKSYLEDVIENEDRYIEEPARFDWNWLKTRVDLN